MPGQVPSVPSAAARRVAGSGCWATLRAGRVRGARRGPYGDHGGRTGCGRTLRYVLGAHARYCGREHGLAAAHSGTSSSTTLSPRWCWGRAKVLSLVAPRAYSGAGAMLDV